MQKTRRYILEILKHQSESTVDEIVKGLSEIYDINITPVTVRHHLNVLFEAGYIIEPKVQHRSSPGRPQHKYSLSSSALDVFPNNYSNLVEQIFSQMGATLPEKSVNVIFEGIAENMIQNANIPDVPLEHKLDAIVEFLDEQGYDASYEKNASDEFILHTRNCPYHHVAQKSDYICKLDMRIITSLLGVVPRKIANISEGEQSCSYLIPVNMTD